MHKLFFKVLAFVSVATMSACGNSDSDRLRIAEEIVRERPDSALVILGKVRYADLTDDGQRAGYALTTAMANAETGRSLITDSLLVGATEYYRAAGDTSRWVLASRLLAGHYYVAGKKDEATAQIDRVLNAVESADVRWDMHFARMEFAFGDQDFETVCSDADWLLQNTSLAHDKLRYAAIKMAGLYFRDCIDEAVALGDSIAGSDFMPEYGSMEWGSFMNDYAHILDGAGRTDEAIEVMDDIITRTEAPREMERISRLLSLAQFKASVGCLSEAKELISQIEKSQALSFIEVYIKVCLLKIGIAYKETGHFPASEMHKVPKKVDLMSRMLMNDRETAMESVRNLDKDRYELVLERQRMWNVILGLVIMLLVCVGVSWLFIIHRRQRLTDAEERIEILTQMLKTVKDSREESKDAMLRKLVLQQLGILKTFAGAPTAQNQDALKKISNVGNDGEPVNALVDWQNLYKMIDELYDNFSAKLADNFPGVFSAKEIQIIMLLKAGFSTKEIGVLTQQTSATIYVRKSAIRKKLATEENGDFIAQLDRLF